MEQMKTLTINDLQFEIVDDAARQAIEDIRIHGNDKSYTYTQTTPAALWTVNHMLAKVPSVTVVDSAGNVVEGDIKHTDTNNTVIQFSGAFAGKAYFN